MKPTDSFNHCLDYLEKTRLPLVTDAKTGADDLLRAKKIVDYLQLNPFSCPVITVGGTNGKGSCVAMIEAILLAAGCRVASITSPHLFYFTERLRVDGRNIDERILVQAFYSIYEAEKKFECQLYFYRFIHLAFMYYCFHAQLDAAVFEIGLGGRCDSVNLVDPDIAVIASIGLDHCHILGDTLEKIAEEKAGIFRPHKPVVSGEIDGERLLKPYADQLGCPFYQYGKDFVAEHPEQLFSRNLAIAKQAVALLPKHLHASEEQIAKAIGQLKLPGRQEYIKSQPAYLLDVSHNPPAIRALTERVKQLAVMGKTHVIFNAMHDKDVQEIINIMLPFVDVWYIPEIHERRMSTAAEIVALLKAHGINAQAFPSVLAAYQAATSAAQSDDLIIACGSFKVVSGMKKVMA